MHDRLDAIAPLLSSMDGSVLRLLLTTLNMFMYVQSQGFRMERVIANTLDPRCKIPYGV